MDMKIKEFKIKYFKNLESIDISTDSKINLIVGKNNVGKTSLIQSLYIAFSTHDFLEYYKTEYHLDSLSSLITYSKNKSTINIKTTRRKPNNEIQIELLRPTIKDTILFIQEETEANFHNNSNEPYLVNLNKRIKETSGDIGKIFESSNMDKIKILIEELIDSNKSKIENNMKNDVIINGKYYPSNGTLDTILDFQRSIFQKYIENVKKESNKRYSEDAINNLLISSRIRLKFGSRLLRSNIRHKSPEGNGILYINTNTLDLRQFSNGSESVAIEIQEIIKNEDLLTDLERFTFRNLVFNRDGVRQEIPLELMGDGFKVFIYIVSMLLQYTKSEIKPVILIEEPEVHMHPGYIIEFVRYLINFSINNDIQFFITTHSEDLINNFLSAEINEKLQNTLKKELKIIRLTNANGENIVDTMNYEDAFENINTLYLDLRGI
jgi:predicted ATPase